jgi:hypothetical protein
MLRPCTKRAELGPQMMMADRNKPGVIQTDDAIDIQFRPTWQQFAVLLGAAVLRPCESKWFNPTGLELCEVSVRRWPSRTRIVCSIDLI